MKEMNPILRNLLVALGVAAAVVVLGIAAKFGGQLVDYVLKNGTGTLLIIAIVALVSAVVFGAVEMIASKSTKINKKKWQLTGNHLRILSKMGGPNGKAKANPSGLFLLLYGNNKKSLVNILTL